MSHRLRTWLDRAPDPIDPLHLATATGRHPLVDRPAPRRDGSRPSGRSLPC